MLKQIINLLKGNGYGLPANGRNHAGKDWRSDDKAKVAETSAQENNAETPTQENDAETVTQENNAETAAQENDAETVTQENNAGSGPGPRRRAKELLAEYGIGRIRSQDDVNRMFWEMATRRMIITKTIATAVRIVVCDNRVMRSFNRKLELYNSFMDSKYANADFRDDRQRMKEMEKAHRAEVVRLTQAVNREVKEKNVIRQKLEQQESAYRKVATKFMSQLRTHQGRFLQTYDYTKEADVAEFLSWFRILKRPVGKKTISLILRHHIGDTASPTLFLDAVERHNAQFQVGIEDEQE